MKLKKETMSKHFIYHIFGKKVGVTNNVVRRMKQQNVKEGEYEILEEHTNAKVASVRERELQIEKGYKVDNIPYWKTIRNSKKAYTPEAQAKRVANIDWKAKVLNTDYKTRTTKIDYKTIAANKDYKAFQAKRIANIDWKVVSAKRSVKISKPIIQYDKQGNFIKEWKSATEAKNELGYKDTSICNCLKGRAKTTGGFIWKYAN